MVKENSYLLIEKQKTKTECTRDPNTQIVKKNADHNRQNGI